MLHHAQFTSNSHALIIVHNYDIYYRLGPRTYQVFRVTDDAQPGVVFNGIPDWLYEGKSNRCVRIIIRHPFPGWVSSICW